MKFTTLRIENFGAISEATLGLDDRGLLLIQGENRDDSSANSNGAGKSTIVEAISWALYGKTAKGVTGDAVVNAAAKKNTRVVLTIEDGSDLYEVTRHRKHKQHKNSLQLLVNGKSETKGTDKLTQAALEALLGANHDVFVAAVYAGQEAMPSLPDKTDRELKELVEEAAGIKLLEKAYEIARARARNAKSALDEAQMDVERAEMGADRAKERSEDVRTTIRTWEAERDARVIDLETAARQHVTDAKALKGDLEKLKSEKQLQDELDRVTQSIDRYSGEQTKREKLEKELSAADRTAVASKTAAQNLAQRLKQQRARLEDEQDRKGQPCPTCKRPHDDDSLAASIATLESEIAETQSVARDAVTRARTDAESAQNARTALDQFVAGMTDLSHALTLRDEIAQRLQHVKDVAGKLERARAQAQEKVTAIKTEKAKQNPYTDQVAKRDAELDEARQKLTDAKKARDAAGDVLETAQDTASVFSAKGVRAHILDTVTPFLNDRTAAYLGALSDGNIEAVWQTLTKKANGELAEKFSINVTHSGGAGGFQALSGGEKRKVRTACALALQDLVATRASKPFEIWIGDEIDAALDVSGLERLMNVLEEKARTRGTVLVISHSDLKDWVREQITVVKENGVSKVVA